jgi:hypothetical protein
MKYQIIKVADKSIFGKLISLFTGSKWNHLMCSLDDSQGTAAIERTPSGMYSVDLSNYRHEYEVICSGTIDDREITERFIRLDTKRYDWIATILFYINRKFKLNIGKGYDKLNCVEMVGYLLDIPELNHSVAPHEAEGVLCG